MAFGHADKWPRLRTLKDSFGVAVLDRFERPSSKEERTAAIQAIIDSLDDHSLNNRNFPREVLHASNLGFIKFALDVEESKTAPFDTLLAKIIADAKDDAQTIGWKNSIFKTIFYDAVYAQEDKDELQESHAIALFDKLSTANPEAAQRAMAYDGVEWQPGLSIASFIKACP